MKPQSPMTGGRMPGPTTTPEVADLESGNESAEATRVSCPVCGSKVDRASIENRSLTAEVDPDGTLCIRPGAAAEAETPRTPSLAGVNTPAAPADMAMINKYA